MPAEVKRYFQLIRQGQKGAAAARIVGCELAAGSQGPDLDGACALQLVDLAECGGDAVAYSKRAVVAQDHEVLFPGTSARTCALPVPARSCW
jgi:hypothetical protein